MMKFLKTIHIMVEGPDGIGKSTVSKMLSTRLNIPLLRMVKAKKAFANNTIEDLSVVFNNVLLQLKNTNYIVDRGPISSIIFSKVYNRTENLDYIYSICKKINPLVIYLTSIDRNQMFAQRCKDKLLDSADRIKIYKEYNNFFKSQDFINYVKINIKNKNQKQVVDAIIEYLVKNNYIEQTDNE